MSSGLQDFETTEAARRRGDGTGGRQAIRAWTRTAAFAVALGIGLGAAGAVHTMAQEAAVPEQPEPPSEPVVQRRAFRCDGWSHRPVFRLGQDHRVRASDSVHDTVLVFGSVVVEGEVCGDLVVVLGNVDLASTAYVRDTLTVVGGRFTAATGAQVDGDLVVVGGAMDVPASFEPGREQILVGLPIIGDRLLGAVPWLTRGLLYGRLIVPDLAWNWYVVAITLFVVMMLNLLFPRATALTTAVIHARPLSAFAAGLLVLLLAGPVLTLLVVSVIGTAVVPFVLFGMFAGWLIGSIAVARWIGASLIAQDDAESRGESTRSLLIGFVVKVVAYMIPLLGITVFALTGVLGLGAATLAFIGAFRAENPRRTPPVVPPPPVGPGGPEGARETAMGNVPADGIAPEPAAPLGFTDVPPPPPVVDWSRPEAPGFDTPLPDDGPRGPAASRVDLRQFPRGSFLERLAAFTLDVVLVALANGVLDLTDRQGAFFIFLLAYHIGFWTWQGTTIGGLICQLRLVRVDGRPLTFTDALVRGLTGVFSLGALGLGCLWILRDEHRQAWHDMVAGTLVVKVPRGLPITS